MNSNQDGNTTANDVAAYQDTLIAARLPEWLRGASVEQLHALGEALVPSLYFNARVREVLAGLQSVEQFAATRLQWALDDTFGAGLDARSLRLRWGHREPVVTAQPIGYPVTQPIYTERPLLEAALRNFSESEALPGGQLAGNRLVQPQPSERTLPSATRFAALCRKLDLGGRYQHYLDSILQADDKTSDDPQRRTSLLSLMARASRHSMLADAHVAHIKGMLGTDEHRLLVRLCNLKGGLKLGEHPLRVRRLSLLGCRIEQIVVLDVRDERYSPIYTSSAKVLVHIPGEPEAPWQVFPSIRHFANHLGKRLRTPSYQLFFSRFVRRRVSLAFFSQVDDGYRGLSDLANIDLEERLEDYALPLFDTLAAARIAQIKDDAAMIAVPTAQLDQQVQAEHDRRLAVEGWALLNLAGFFVPALGVALLAITAWQLLGEVFHGVEAWHEGDGGEALEHLLNVATDLAMLAATAAGIRVAQRAWSRSTWVDGLIPVQLDDGSHKLWQPDVTRYRTGAPPVLAMRDEAGIYRLGQQRWVEMDGHHYPVRQRPDDSWCLATHGGHGPRLVHNGAGAWRLWCEQPLHWDGVPYLVRRMGGLFSRLDDRQVDLLMAAHDLDAGQLRGLHVHGQKPDAEWVDSAIRLEAAGRVERLAVALAEGRTVDDAPAMRQLLALAPGGILDDEGLAELTRLRCNELFVALYDARQPVDDPSTAQLRRQFPGLHRLAAEALLRQAHARDRRTLIDSGRVPLRLAEAARASVRRIRQARACEGFYLAVPQTSDLARCALTLSEHLPGASAGLRWRLHEGSLAGPLLLESAGQGGRELSLVHQAGRFQLFEAGGASLGGPGDLFDVMAAAYDVGHRQASGLGEPFAATLRAMLGALAGPHRAQLAQVLGERLEMHWFRPPQRLPDGRIGYPLSGRGQGSPRRLGLFAMVRALYPTFDDAQVATWLEQVRQSGRTVEAELARLGAELEALSAHLNRWCGMARNRLQRAERRSFANGLQACWQRRTLRTHVNLGATYRLTMRNLSIENLPALPGGIAFAHVRELSLMAVGVREVPDDFLRAFSQVRILELSNNQLVRVPEGLVHLPMLRELDLFGNQIVLDAAQARRLSRCQHLEYLNLSYNPLGRGFSVNDMPRLRRLMLRQTGLEDLPSGLLARFELTLADLRDNRIQRIRPGFYRAPSWVSACIRLEGNALREADAQRLQAFRVDHGWPTDAEEVTSLGAARQRWLDAAGSLARADQSSMWDELETYENADDFFSLLRRLLQTAEFQQHREALARRVFALLQAVCDNDSLRDELFTQASLPVTCQDSAALTFSALELRLLVWQARNQAASGGERSALLRLGRQLWRLDEVDRIAERDYQARRTAGADPDQLEVVLAYRVGLREVLDLPAQPSDMLFAEVAGLDQARIDHARDEVLAYETPGRLGQSLVDRDFWREHLLHVHGDRFEALDADFHARVEALMASAESMSEGSYLEAMNAVQTERDVARRALLLKLTNAALADEPGPSGQR